ncbi:MAG TPA: gliding motility lipoprotein GldB [Daejeonella sp.]|nr:gliding motility lipoprotein GldB [Daejeonella sp.]
MILNKAKQIYLFLGIGLMLASCTNKKRVDISNINLNLTIERFDLEMDSLTEQNLVIKAPQLQKKYGAFYADYMEKMLGVGSVADTNYYQQLRQVLQNPDYQDLKASVAAAFPNMVKNQQELTDAFKHIRYYYPQQKLPRLITFLSGFAVQTPIGNNYIGIGLDMFLGADAKYYPALRQSIPQYISRRFSPQNVAPRVIEGFIREDMFPEKDANRSLLSKMIYNGKILYFMDEVMPNLPDSLKIGYTQKQLGWCDTYKAEIWANFLENNLLYETDYMKIQKYLAEAPFTPGIGENSESSPKLGVYTGWQIVKKYMEKNPEITLQQLMQETDAQKILSGSKYKPK